jgi:hypothetical protein
LANVFAVQVSAVMCTHHMRFLLSSVLGIIVLGLVV